MSDWRLFRRSLANHPGLIAGVIWPLLVLGAIAQREDSSSLPWLRVMQVVAVVGALPWIPIIWTAWSGRKQYATDEGEQP